ncbi:NnrU family protein [Dongia sedimenti]|uniref:NnrU family protein n=1 Tax=Dongia sedimenti TaxID=3064282 RepID=A0ABU0YNI2_9PROT|nr:NnrU family protein [Rhodospirillaceae bacterium R-7]
MLNLVAAACAFVAAHFLISSTGLRPRLVSRIGERAYTALFSLQALLLIVWMALAFQAAPRDRLLWEIPGIAHLLLTVMPIVLVLAAAGFGNPNPSAVMMAAPDGGWQPKGILTVTRHPVMWAFGLWALLHAFANGDLAGLVFFGAFAVLALLGTLAIDAKKRHAWTPEGWQAFSAATSNLPFLAIAQGRTRLDWKGIGWKPVAIAAGLYLAVIFWFHPRVIGAPLF